jgi:FkbM family methyltransferase
MLLDHIQAHHINEDLTSVLYTNAVKSGDHVIDLGANHGHHTCKLSRLVGASGLVHAFEPNRHLMKALLEIPNTRVWPYAVGDEVSIQRLHIPVGLDGWASLKDIRDELSQREFDVQTVVQLRIDDISEIETEKITFVKMDVERREFQAFEGMKNILALGRAVIVAENVTPSIAALTSAFGYRSARLHPEIDLPNSILLPPSASEALRPSDNQIAAAFKRLPAVA